MTTNEPQSIIDRINADAKQRDRELAEVSGEMVLTSIVSLRTSNLLYKISVAIAEKQVPLVARLKLRAIADAEAEIAEILARPATKKVGVQFSRQCRIHELNNLIGAIRGDYNRIMQEYDK